jgi:hypothetical protein
MVMTESAPAAGRLAPAALSDTELELAMATLQDQIRAIEMQMSDRNKLGADGARLVGAAYWAWRHRARYAWQAKTAEYRALKLERKRRATQPPRPPVEPPPAAEGDTHLLALYSYLHEQARRGWTPPPDLQGLLDAARAYLRARGRLES